MALETVQKYIDEARVLLKDQVAPYRYSDAEMTRALNHCISEATRIRPDLFFKALREDATFPEYTTTDTTTLVDVDRRFRVPVLYYIVAFMQVRDDEDTTDARAASMLSKFLGQISSPVG